MSLYKLYINHLKKQKNRVKKHASKRGFEFFKNICFIKEHQKLKLTEKIHGRSSTKIVGVGDRGVGGRGQGLKKYRSPWLANKKNLGLE